MSAEASKARAKVSQLGVGQSARVDVKLKDQTKIKGYISGAEQDSFTVVDKVTGDSHSVSYNDVLEV